METTHYYRYDDGSYSQQTTTTTASEPGHVEVPEGAVEITQAEYEAGLAALAAAHQEHLDELKAAEDAEAREAYVSLLAAGIPEAIARRLSGYTGDLDEVS